METSWFGIPDATRKVTELSDMHPKSPISRVKIVPRCTCWTNNAFDYNIGNTSGKERRIAR